MNIGFDFRMGGSNNAGIGRYSFELLTHLLDEAKAKGLEPHRFVVFYHQENNTAADLEILRSKGAELVPANFRHYSWSEQTAFPKLLNKHNLDLVHFPNFNVPIFYRGDYVVTIHDVVHHKVSGHKKSRYHKFLAYKFIINRAVSKSKKIITVTNAAKQEIIELLNAPADKISVTYEAPTPFQGKVANFAELAAQYYLERPYILFVGTLERKKNLINLARGFDKFISKYKFDLDLLVVGKTDPHYPEIRQQMLAIKHSDNLVFTGFVSDAVQASLYQNAFAFISASFHEGFGLPGLEAMEYGVPVLAANTAVFNEVYDNAAIFFDGLEPDDIAEKINLLVSDQPFYEAMQQKGLSRSQEFDWRKTAKQTLMIYNEVKGDGQPAKIAAESLPSTSHEPEIE
jgi:glycosyltransferase involved in cell wall biosynthesis